MSTTDLGVDERINSGNHDFFEKKEGFAVSELMFICIFESTRENI